MKKGGERSVLLNRLATFRVSMSPCSKPPFANYDRLAQEIAKFILPEASSSQTPKE